MFRFLALLVWWYGYLVIVKAVVDVVSAVDALLGSWARNIKVLVNFNSGEDWFVWIIRSLSLQNARAANVFNHDAIRAVVGLMALPEECFHVFSPMLLCLFGSGTFVILRSGAQVSIRILIVV